MTTDYFLKFARYNRWANKRIFDTCATLTSSDYFKMRPSFFGSIHRTLNHILTADIIWLARFRGDTPFITRLDAELETQLSALWEHRQRMDLEIEEYVAGLRPEILETDLKYKLISEPAGEMSTPFVMAIAHFFNHQTHHRGQVHDQISQTNLAPPPLDLIYFLREKS